MAYSVSSPEEIKDIARSRCISESESKPPGRFSGYDICKVADRLASRFPISSATDPSLKVHFWFTNELPGSFKKQKNSLIDTITSISKLRIASERKVSIVTGEAGLLSCIPELSAVSKLIIQVDHDPVLLIFIQELLKNISTLKSTNKDKQRELIKLSLSPLRKSGDITAKDESKILALAEEYKNAMGKLHCLSSQHRLEEFKSALCHCRVQAVQADYFSKEDMGCLSKILEDEGLEVSFFNVSNVYEYYSTFYSINPFNGLILGVESTAFVRVIPLARDALCAYSLINSGSDHTAHTATCAKDLLFNHLYAINKSAALSKVARYSGRYNLDENDLASACVALATIDFISSKSAISILRLIFAYITKEEAMALTFKIKKIDQHLAENKRYNTESRRQFIAITSAAIREGMASTV